MTQGFYEQFGVRPSASLDDLRAAYARVVTQIGQRRKALIEQGGDATPIDVHRSEVEEAWRVLSSPERRRRYDAMLAMQQQGGITDPDEVWKRSAGALVPPAISAAAEFLRTSTTLDVGMLPVAPRPDADEAAAHDDLTQPTVVPVRGNGSRASVVPLPTAATSPPSSSLRVVEGHSAGAPVIMMPTPGAQVAPLRGSVSDLVQEHGYSGPLLRAVRELRGLSLQDLSDSSRISVRYLEAVEDDDYERLPSATFVRGYVREMARLLELQEDRMVDGYMRRLADDA